MCLWTSVHLVAILSSSWPTKYLPCCFSKSWRTFNRWILTASLLPRGRPNFFALWPFCTPKLFLFWTGWGRGGGESRNRSRGGDTGDGGRGIRWARWIWRSCPSSKSGRRSTSLKGRSNPQGRGLLGDGGMEIFPTLTGSDRCLERDEMLGYKMIKILPKWMKIYWQLTNPIINIIDPYFGQECFRSQMINRLINQSDQPFDHSGIAEDSNTSLRKG